VEWWVNEGILGIEDVTSMAENLRNEMGNKRAERKSVAELVEVGCLPVEEVYEVDEELGKVLEMDFVARLKKGAKGLE
jgi:hypothetical protein